jgi:cell division protein DivIC
MNILGKCKVFIIQNFNKTRLKNKYFIAAGLFFLWIAFFDDNNLVERFQYLREISRLNDDKTYFQKKIGEDSERLKQLKTNKKNLEKFAREQYLMKRDNEDVFVLVEE